MERDIRKVVNHVIRSVRRDHPNRYSFRAVHSIIPIQLDQPQNFVFKLFSILSRDVMYEYLGRYLCRYLGIEQQRELD